VTGEVVEVVAAVVERDGKLLITRRRAGTHLGGLWEFPGGKADPGEPAARALQREILEELGVAVSVGEPLAIVDWTYPDKRVRIRFFRCAVTGEPRPQEGQEMAWVAPADLGRHRFPPADAELIARLSSAQGSGPSRGGARRRRAPRRTARPR
jgi:mutator protein MutT